MQRYAMHKAINQASSKKKAVSQKSERKLADYYYKYRYNRSIQEKDRVVGIIFCYR